MKKRFNNAAEIHALADKYKQEIIELRLKAASKHNLADYLRDTEEVWRIPSLRATADSINQQVSWREARLETLKGKLGEIQTMQLPTMETEDTSVPT